MPCRPDVYGQVRQYDQEVERRSLSARGRDRPKHLRQRVAVENAISLERGTTERGRVAETTATYLPIPSKSPLPGGLFALIDQAAGLSAVISTCAAGSRVPGSCA